MLRNLICHLRRWLELPLLLASCTGLLVILAIAAILIFVACTTIAMWRTASRLLPRRAPRSLPVNQLRDFFSCPDNYAHATSNRSVRKPSPGNAIAHSTGVSANIAGTGAGCMSLSIPEAT